MWFLSSIPVLSTFVTVLFIYVLIFVSLASPAGVKTWQVPKTICCIISWMNESSKGKESCSRREVQDPPSINHDYKLWCAHYNYERSLFLRCYCQSDLDRSWRGWVWTLGLVAILLYNPYAKASPWSCVMQDPHQPRPSSQDLLQPEESVDRKEVCSPRASTTFTQSSDAASNQQSFTTWDLKTNTPAAFLLHGDYSSGVPASKCCSWLPSPSPQAVETGLTQPLSVASLCNLLHPFSFAMFQPCEQHMKERMALDPFSAQGREDLNSEMTE